MDDEEILEQSEEQLDMVEQPEPLVIETKGKWRDFEVISGREFEIGKTYKIEVQGQCKFMISPTKPNVGIGTNEITFTKDEVNKLWIITG